MASLERRSNVNHRQKSWFKWTDSNQVGTCLSCRIADSSRAILPPTPLSAAAAAQEPVIGHGHFRRERSDLLTKRRLCAIRGGRQGYHSLTSRTGSALYTYQETLECQRVQKDKNVVHEWRMKRSCCLRVRC